MNETPLPFTVEIPVEATRQVKFTEIVTIKSGGHLPRGNGKALLLLDDPYSNTYGDHYAEAQKVMEFMRETFPSGVVTELYKLLKLRDEKGIL